MANWRKLLKPGPVELGTQHLDGVTVPDTYVQRTSAVPLKSLGYPYDGVPGTLMVLPWNPAIPRVIAVFYPWSERPIVKRTSNADGTWRPWVDALGNEVA